MVAGAVPPWLGPCFVIMPVYLHVVVGACLSTCMVYSVTAAFERDVWRETEGDTVSFVGDLCLKHTFCVCCPLHQGPSTSSTCVMQAICITHGFDIHAKVFVSRLRGLPFLHTSPARLVVCC